MTLIRLITPLLCLTLTVPLADAARRPLKAKSIGDAITTAAIDIATNAVQTKLSRVPSDGQIEIAFAPVPKGSAERLVIKIIEAAKFSVFMSAYQMTSKPIADAMCRAVKRGAAVSAVLDAKANRIDDYRSKQVYLRNCGVDVRLSSRYAIMHNKFIVADGRHVETGSFNYSYAASARNAENAIVVWNNAAMASKYAQEFDRLFTEARD